MQNDHFDASTHTQRRPTCILPRCRQFGSSAALQCPDKALYCARHHEVARGMSRARERSSEALINPLEHLVRAGLPIQYICVSLERGSLDRWEIGQCSLRSCRYREPTWATPSPITQCFCVSSLGSGGNGSSGGQPGAAPQAKTLAYQRDVSFRVGHRPLCPWCRHDVSFDAGTPVDILAVATWLTEAVGCHGEPIRKGNLGERAR